MPVVTYAKAIPQKILIIRTSAIGDVIMASPLINSLSKTYPNAQLYWLVEPHLMGLVKDHPDIAGVIPFNKGQWKNLAKSFQWFELLKTWWQFVRNIRQHKFELVIDVQGLLKTGIWAGLSGAKRRVGFVSKEPTKWFFTEQITKPLNDPEISSEYKKMAAYLGCDTARFFMDLRVNQADVAVVKSLLARHPNCQVQPSSNQARSFIVIAPFTTRAQKHWPFTHWQSLLRLIVQRYDCPVFIVGGPGDKAQAERLVQDHTMVINTCGQLSLMQSVELINQAYALVGVDTGMTHAGLAKQTPTIALFGSTRPYLQTNVDVSDVLYLNKPCAPCKRKPSCDGAFHCLSDITPEQVLTRLELLALSNLSKAIA